MSTEMVHAVERHAPGQCQPLGGRHPDQERTGQPGPDGRRDDVGSLHPGKVQRAPCGDAQRFQVRAGSDLRHHSAETRMFLDTGGHLVGQQHHRPVGGQFGDTHSGFVTGAFDSEDDCHGSISLFHLAVCGTLHGEGIGTAAGVVPLAQPDGLKPGALVQGNRRGIIGAYLQKTGPGS